MKEIVKIEAILPENQNRLETGPLQINEDWPGIYIRGDNAFFFANAIRSILNGQNDFLTKGALESLQHMLSSCNLHKNGD